MQRSSSTGAAAATYETLKSLPAAEHPYSDYDLGIVAEIIRLADGQAKREAKLGTGAGVEQSFPCGAKASRREIFSAGLHISQLFFSAT